MTKTDVFAVIGIIGILGLLLLPWNPSPVKAEMANCIGNLKQLGCAAAIYEVDKTIYPGPQPMGIGITEISWDRPLAMQLGANLGKDGNYEPLANLTQVPPCVAFKVLGHFTCPADSLAGGARVVPITPGSTTDGTAPGNGICRSYTMNLGSGNLVKDVDDGIAATAAAVPIEKIESSAGTVYLIENHGYATVFGQRNIANDTYLTCDRTGNMIPKDAFAVTMMPKHGKKAKPRVNALMYDGHVETLDPVAITADGGNVMQYHK